MIGFDLIKKNNLLEFKEYLKYGDLKGLDEFGNNMLGYSVLLNRFEFVILLLDILDINHQNYQGDTIMHLAIQNKNSEIIKLIKRYDYKYKLKNSSNMNVIEEAIYIGDYNIFKLVYNYKLRERDLIFATKYFNKKIFKIVFETNKKLINCTDKFNNSLLHIACEINNSDLVDFLLNKNIKYYLKNRDGETAIFNAFRYSSIKIIKKLINYLPLDSVNIYEETLDKFTGEEKKYLLENKNDSFIFAIINESKQKIKEYSKNITEKEKKLAKDILLDYQNYELLELLYDLI